MVLSNEQLEYQNNIFILKYKMDNPKTKYTKTEILFICKFRIINPHIQISDKEIIKKHDILDKDYDSSKKNEKKENILDKYYDYSNKTSKKGKTNILNSMKKNVLNVYKNTKNRKYLFLDE